MILNLGVDSGKTWLRACLCDGHGRVHSRRRQPACAPSDIAGAVKSIKKYLHLGPLETLAVGAAGIWTAPARRALASALKSEAKKVFVLSDLELAHLAAFAGGGGILLLGGTGSAAFARNADKTARAGGLGPLLGDEGSAFWIGKKALQDHVLKRGLPKALAIAHGAAPVRQTAALAVRVLKWAQGGRSRFRRPAAAIIDDAAGHLAGLARETAERLNWRGKIPISWAGGLFASQFFRARVARALKAPGPGFILRPPLLSPELAAARLPRLKRRGAAFGRPA